MGTAFGGTWTEEKLEVLRKYLVAYATIMRNTPFRFAYIDAFAGSGYREQQSKNDASEPLFPELADQESQAYREGSARIALQVTPGFDKYIFLEQQGQAVESLSTLRTDFPQHAQAIEVIQADANAWLQDRCLNYTWKKNRAVVFLDPFGMQVAWETIEAIAATKAIDLWVLFPLGVAVNRLLRKDGQIQESWSTRLNHIFGTADWYSRFYAPTSDLFGETRPQKAANLEAIGQFYNERLREVFGNGRVAANPRQLLNSRKNPLYLFCFAAGNPTGAKTAIKIAQHILDLT
jgi:three-Cys-motif partner protein